MLNPSVDPFPGRSATDDPPMARALPVSSWVAAPTASPDGIRAASVILPTHNDGGNIGPLLDRLLEEPCVGEIVVVASACSDQTVPIARERAAGAAGRIRLYVEPVRTGKAAAVNFGVTRSSLTYVVIVSGDVLPEPGAIAAVVDALDEPGVGMAGGRPVPVNGAGSTLGHAVHLLWGLHHRLAMRQPKLGEMIALRREAADLLPRTSVDEATFQAMLESAGWKSRYVPEAVVANRGPGTMRDFVKQRRQINTGHLWLRHREGYTVASLHVGLLVREFCAEVLSRDSTRRPRSMSGTGAAVGMELWARLLARWDYLRGREQHVWDMVASTKDPARGANGLGAGDGERLEG